MSDSVRIGSADTGYLYCDVVDIPSTYAYMGIYATPDECFADIKEDILESCRKREYSDAETEKVLRHYRVRLDLYPGEWKLDA